MLSVWKTTVRPKLPTTAVPTWTTNDRLCDDSVPAPLDTRVWERICVNHHLLRPTSGAMGTVMPVRRGARRALEPENLAAARNSRSGRRHPEDALDMGNARVCVRWRRLLAGGIVAGLCLTGAINAAAGSDGVAPHPPTVVVKQSSTTALSFTWSVVPGERLTGYDVYFGDVRVGPTTFTRADFRNLACNQRYVFRLIAFDGQGHRSTPSVTLAQTSACQATPPARSEPPGSSKGDTRAPPPPSGPPPVVQPPAPTPVPQPPASGSGASLAVASAGSDSNSCTPNAPCATFNRAYQQASPGQSVTVAAGSYPAQTIQVDARKLSATADVIFQPAPGAQVRVAGVSIFGSHVELRNLQTRGTCARARTG